MSKIYFVRSAITLQAEPVENDLWRILSQTGIQQTRKLATKIGELDIVFSSPATRAHQTAVVVGGKTPIYAVPAFYWHPHQFRNSELVKWKKQLGDVSLTEYFKYPVAKELLQETSESAIDQGKRIDERYGKPRIHNSALFVGHHPLLNDFIYRLALDENAINNIGVAEFVKTAVLKPGEAFEIITAGNPGEKTEVSIRHITLD